LCDEFLRGALETGNEVEKVFVNDKDIKYCKACEICYSGKAPCIHGDDMGPILEKMLAADVIVMATPVYFYAMNGQMKTLIDRTIGRFLEARDKEFYFILAAHDDRKDSMERVLESFRGYLACLKGAKEMGVVYGLGVFHVGDIHGSPAMEEAYEMGKSIAPS
jgi:multimeric flavodoxin WrbA